MSRPNIRVEFHNNLSDDMDFDGEDGEIVESDNEAMELEQNITQSANRTNCATSQQRPKNPWTVLARDWDQDLRHREQEPSAPDLEVRKIEVKNPALMVRLGQKQDLDSFDKCLETTNFAQKKSKAPRMQMYADEEEAKQKRRRMLQSVKKPEKSDLRTVLGLNKPKPDLGLRLEKRPSDNGDVRLILDRKKAARPLTRNVPAKPIKTDYFGKTRSKVAVVIKTQKQPSVASTVCSKMHQSSDSSSSDEYEYDDDDDDAEVEYKPQLYKNKRPGFGSDLKSRLSRSHHYQSPLTIEFSNDG